jgi:HSP20 family protein
MTRVKLGIGLAVAESAEALASTERLKTRWTKEICMRSLMPWTGMPSLKHEMERMFDRFADFKLDEFPATGEWAPSMDVSETKDAVMVKAEVPGMDSKDIQISLQEQLLTIKGEKQMVKEEKEERYYRMERTYGAFTRTVRLPVAVDGSKVSASFKNGLLTVTLPKTPAAKGTTIPIKAE